MNDTSETITCAYCGAAYPAGTPATKHERLSAHIDVCDKHPMFELRKRVQVLADLSKGFGSLQNLSREEAVRLKDAIAHAAERTPPPAPEERKETWCNHINFTFENGYAGEFFIQSDGALKSERVIPTGVPFRPHSMTDALRTKMWIDDWIMLAKETVQNWVIGDEHTVPADRDGGCQATGTPTTHRCIATRIGPDGFATSETIWGVSLDSVEHAFEKCTKEIKTKYPNSVIQRGGTIKRHAQPRPEAKLPAPR